MAIIGTLHSESSAEIVRLETVVTHLKGEIHNTEIKVVAPDTSENNYIPMVLDHVPAKYLADATENPVFVSATWIIQAPDSNGEMRDWYKHADGYSQDRPDA